MKQILVSSMLLLTIKYSAQAQTTRQLLDSNYINGDSYDNFKTNSNTFNASKIWQDDILIAINNKIYKPNAPEVTAMKKDSITSMHIFTDTSSKATIKKIVYITTVPKKINQ